MGSVMLTKVRCKFLAEIYSLKGYNNDKGAYVDGSRAEAAAVTVKTRLKSLS